MLLTTIGRSSVIITPKIPLPTKKAWLDWPRTHTRGKYAACDTLWQGSLDHSNNAFIMCRWKARRPYLVVQYPTRARQEARNFGPMFFLKGHGNKKILLTTHALDPCAFSPQGKTGKLCQCQFCSNFRDSSLCDTLQAAPGPPGQRSQANCQYLHGHA